MSRRPLRECGAGSYAVPVVGVRLLGPVVVEADTTVPLGGAKQRGLFALLAGSVPPRRTDDQLIQGLWGEEPPASARNAVQVYVTGLRRALQPLGLGIARSGDGYALTGSAYEVDVVRFETVVAQGRAALRGGDAGRAADLLEQALRLWGGTPFDGVGDLPAFEQWRDALVAVRQSARADLATALLRTGRYDEAIATAQALVADHPYDERGWVVAATAQYWAGRQAAALETCTRARDLLADELGVDPGPELAQLPTQILRQELRDPTEGRAAPDGGADDEAAEPVPSLPPLPPAPDPFVGRQDAVQEVLDLVAAGRRVITLVGMGGIGKTTLSLAVAHRLHEADRAVLFCELEAETDAASALDRVCRDLGVDPEDDAAAAIGSGPADVIVLDNAEQVDGLGAALGDLVRRYAAPQFVLTSRTHVGARGEQTVPVSPLLVGAGEGEASPATELFWAAAARVRPDIDRGGDDADVRQLCELLGGIPLAIELVAGRMRTQTPAHLLRRVVEHRTSLLDTRSTGHLPARQATLRVVIDAAVGSLSGPARQLLRLAAGVDGWVRQETLEQVADPVLADDFLAALDELSSHGLAAVDRAGRVRLPPPVREFVREDGGAPVEPLLPVVVDLAEEFGARLYGPEASEALANLTGDADVLGTVLNRAVEDGAPAETVAAAARLLIALRRYWLLASRIPEARRWSGVLRDRAALGELDRARLAILDGNLAQWVDDHRARDLLESGLADATRLGAPSDRLLVSGWCSLAAHTATYGEVDTAERAVAQAAATAAESGDPLLVGLVQDLEGFVANQLGDLETALNASLRGLETARAAGDEYDIVTLLTAAAEVLSELGRDAEAVRFADEAFERTTRLELGPQWVVGLVIRAAVQVAAGQVAAARGSVLEGLRSARRQHPAPKTFADGLRTMAAVEAASGRDEEAARLTGAALAIMADLQLDNDGTSRVDLVAAAARDRMGEGAWRAVGAIGAADPMGVLDRLLAEPT